MSEDATTEPTTDATEQPGADARSVPPWERDGTPFDPETAWSRITTQSQDIDKLRVSLNEAQAKVTQYEEAQLTEAQRAERDLNTAREQVATQALENARLRAVIDHGLSADDIELLGGNSPEEIAGKAAKLAARLGSGTPTTPLSSRPNVALRGGADPTTNPTSGGDWLRDALARNAD